MGRRGSRLWLGTVEVRTFLTTGRDLLIPIEEAPKPRSWKRGRGGSVEIVVNGRAVVARETWDDIEWLWSSLARMIATLNGGSSYATELPYLDQAIDAGIAHQADDMVVLVCGHRDDRRRAVADKHTFFDAFTRAGLDAFDHLERLGGGRHAGGREALVDCRHGLYQNDWPAVRQRACTGSEAENETKAFFQVHRLAW
ncbi:hypothetical protein [Myceligenerans crystallogenes]|uniref:Uncharacterized protein n=1 Tax=Myceligenerans crystallogenes TaxID=316335 RepID=A0ABP4ZH84_9MICO